ncbi:phospholipase D domain protein [Streptococcus cristatus ATCC 51100]|uniref:Cardiolipin synthase n=1 Tax=Streptococcus cristatus ATCC 51100 TaxID=889201 RepID=A0AAV3EG70_STRCR|nr:cardiolipin synthase [Streptococcus cristatus]EFX52412.1 phospholipase D domain protein [Streptococcus cristatus ATCC 51100]EGU68415.1 phospholipase D domain protein [Streptococcus cristatus ATCC 51100]KJQ60511.1 cardiolipin synthetase [Streptococcus cristatus]SQG33171.1 phosphatidylserine/phosphatidylglycerophosphate/ cardiolipin synthase-like protein [Streptococcus cristatus ATCC 51100]
MNLGKFRLLMSKYGFSIIIMLLELLLVFAAFFYFNQLVPNWLSALVIVSLYIGTILAIVNRNMPPESKVTWLLFAVVPVFGFLLYLMIGERRLSKKEIQQLEKMDSMKFREDNSYDLRVELKQENKSAFGIVKSLLSMDHNADVYDGTASQYFSLGEEMFEAMLDDLRSAKKFIFLEFYIIDPGLMWNRVLEILVDKVQQGVEVKLLYDDIGCMATLPGDYTKRLRKMGIDAHKFNKVIPRMTVAYNNRDHRKILVVDGQVGYTGGINLADEYINHIVRFGHWKDGGVRLEGRAVKALTRLFLMNWYINRGEITDFDRYHFDSQRVEGKGLYIPYGSGPKPIYKEQVGKAVYQNIINQAIDYVYITTPYLIIDYDLTEDIKNAAMRGVDVRIVTPFIPDKKLIQIVTRGAYPDLLEAGVKIYEYTPGFIHSKNVISDDELAVVGTINFDYRSLVHHYENAVLMYQTESIADIKRDFEDLFDVSKEISLETLQNSWYQRLLKEIMQLFAPLL